MEMSLSNLWEIVKDREACRPTACGVAKSQTQQWLDNESMLEAVQQIVPLLQKERETEIS